MEKPDFDDHFEVLFQRSFNIFPEVEFLVTVWPQMRLKKYKLYFIKKTSSESLCQLPLHRSVSYFSKIYFNKFHKTVK